MDLLASGEPEEIEHLSDEELDDRPRAPRPPTAQRLRTVAPILAALTVGAVLAAVATSGWRDRQQEIQAASTATLGLILEQAVPQGWEDETSSGDTGTVRVYLVVENRSPGPVRLDSVQAEKSRGVLRAVVHDWRPKTVAPAETIRIRLDVSPDCDDGPAVALPALRLSVTPGEGGRRDVQVQPAREPDSRDPAPSYGASYPALMTAQCEALAAAENPPGFQLRVDSYQLAREGDRTASLELRIGADSIDGRVLPAGSVTAATLTLAGIRVVQPTKPVPLVGRDSTPENALVFSLTVDDCDLALGPGRERGVLEVTAAAGSQVATLNQPYDGDPSLKLEVLEYLLDVCR